MADLDVRVPAVPATPATGAREDAAARAQLRAQIATLERQLSDALIACLPYADGSAVAPPPARASSRGPRLLDLGDLERARDELAARLSAARAEQRRRGERAARARARLEAMRLEPGRHRFAQVTRAELGEGRCGIWQVRPRLGVLGMLMGWWEVKLSSGCPLAERRRLPAAPRRSIPAPMGRRSRKRGGASAAGPAAPAASRTPGGPHAAPATHRAPMGEAPKAPWAPFPLVELCVLVAIVLIVLGFLSDGPRRGALLACGVALASLAGLEIAIREHVAGFRSHSALLAGAAAVLVAVPLFFLTGLPQIGLLAVGVAVYTLAFFGLRRAFQAKTGGLGFRA